MLKDSFREVCNPKFTLKLKNSVKYYSVKVRILLFL